MKLAWLYQDLPYIFGDRLGPADPRCPRLLYGSRSACQHALSQIDSAKPYTHFALSHALEDRPTDSEMVDDAFYFLRHLLPGISLQDIFFLVVRHNESAGASCNTLDERRRLFRSCAHVFVVNVHGPSGKRIQPYYAPAHGQRLWELVKSRNLERGYACPSEPFRVRARQNLSEEDLKELKVLLLETSDCVARRLEGFDRGEWRKELLATCPIHSRVSITQSDETPRAIVQVQGRKLELEFNEQHQQTIAAEWSPPKRRSAPSGSIEASRRDQASRSGNGEVDPRPPRAAGEIDARDPRAAQQLADEGRRGAPENSGPDPADRQLLARRNARKYPSPADCIHNLRSSYHMPDLGVLGLNRSAIQGCGGRLVGGTAGLQASRYEGDAFRPCDLIYGCPTLDSGNEENCVRTARPSPGGNSTGSSCGIVGSRSRSSAGGDLARIARAVESTVRKFIETWRVTAAVDEAQPRMDL